MIQRLFKVGALLFLMFQQHIIALAFPTAVGTSTTTASMTTIATQNTNYINYHYYYYCQNSCSNQCCHCYYCNKITTILLLAIAGESYSVDIF